MNRKIAPTHPDCPHHPTEAMDPSRKPHPVFEYLANILFKISKCQNLHLWLREEARPLARKLLAQAYSSQKNFVSVELITTAGELFRAAPHATRAAIPEYLKPDVDNALKLVDSLFELPKDLEPIIEQLYRKLDTCDLPPGTTREATLKTTSEEPARNASTAPCSPRRRRNTPCSNCGSTRY